MKVIKILRTSLLIFSKLYISPIVIGDLYIGINRVRNKVKHLKNLSDFLTLCHVLNVDNTTAEYYGIIVASLYKKGKPIPTNDVWIAATALQHNLTLVTTDKHFNEIDKFKNHLWRM